MRPRTEVDFIDSATPLPAALAFALSRPHSRYPVVRGSHDDVLGFVNIRDLLDPTLPDSTTVGELAREVAAFPATNRVLPVLSALRARRAHLAIVVDEYGGTAGIVTVEDLVEEIRDEFDPPAEPTRELSGGLLEVDGLLNLEDFAGFLVAKLGHIAHVGEAVPVEGHSLEVSELDGRRVARVRVSRVETAELQE